MGLVNDRVDGPGERAGEWMGGSAGALRTADGGHERASVNTFVQRMQQFCELK